ncbi:aurora kinase A-interacting protein [Hypanus sabinus]|uniref:aurora kinase A-interacting protein n=1 Tax=Hypanus sabinus TaxID=79690 RepID=UPI0028C399F8|nr:aurora kinase A-interacting protein [Hypanus sabinus]XP_059808011.1 aurora kinase A-interacting protein [Hypanus sabinus]XP_059808012.1 aurora kinase A-interacting protein [Hypanus sabinus]XP_059808013.1 aurora kinase A-interacting protein [Hypanus sabinus]
MTIMILSRLSLQLAKAHTFPGMQALFGSVLRRCSTLSKDCYTSPRHKLKPQRWCALDHELEELLIPRKLSISPSESWLTIKYWVPSLGLNHGQGIGVGLGNPLVYDCPPLEESQLFEEDGATINYKIDKIECKNVLKIRRRKMNRHKYKKLLKRTKFLRRRVKEGRRRRRQVKFERDLKQIWKKAGLKVPPEGWQAPKIYVKQYHGKSE